MHKRVHTLSLSLYLNETKQIQQIIKRSQHLLSQFLCPNLRLIP